MMQDYGSLLPRLEQLARLAGAAIMEIYGTDFSVGHKDDQSPVTLADQKAEALILPGLHDLTPDIPIVAEEEAAAGRIPTVRDAFWLVDPLDGTKEFIRRNGEFTVNIGLIVHGIPVAGTVYAPALDVLWSGAGNQAWRQQGSDRRPMHCRKAPASGARVLTSRSHRNPQSMDEWLAQLNQPQLDFAGSSLKFCHLAEGSADYYPRFGPTCEWDTAAAHAVLLAAGGEVITFDGQPLGYNKPQFLNPDFLAQARP